MISRTRNCLKPKGKELGMSSVFPSYAISSIMFDFPLLNSLNLLEFARHWESGASVINLSDLYGRFESV